MYVVMCLLAQAGLLPGLPFTLLMVLPLLFLTHSVIFSTLPSTERPVCY